MWRKLLAVVLGIALPASASAGSLAEALTKPHPMADAVAQAAREVALAQEPRVSEPGRSGRFWTGVALLVGGGVLSALGAFEVGDDDEGGGPDDAEDNDDSDDGEDGDGLHKALLGSGIAAAGSGGWLLLTGRSASPSISSPRGVSLRHTVRF